MRAFRDRPVAVILLLFAVYTVAAARDMSYMQGRTPGPGFAPFWIGVGLAIASLAIVTRRAGGSGQAVGTGAGITAPRRISTLVASAAITVLGVALIESIGMIAALALLLLGLVRVFGGSWRTAGLTAIALPAGLYVLFGRWLQVPLPRGPWGF